MKKKHFAFLFAVFLLVPAATHLLAGVPVGTPQSSMLTALEIEKGDKETAVKIAIEGDFSYTVFWLKNPLRLAIDFSPVQSTLTEKEFDIQKSGVLRIRTSQFQPDITRIVFDLANDMPMYRFTRDAAGIVIAVWQEEEPKPAVEEVKPRAPAAPPAVKSEKRPVAAPAPVSPEPAKTSGADMMLGVSLGSYSISDEIHEEVYGKGGTILGFQVSRLFLTEKDLHFGLSLEGRYYSKSGASAAVQEETKLTLFPVSLSALGFYRSNNFLPFAGLGLDYYSYSEKSDLHEASGSAWGYHIQGGVYFIIPRAENLRIGAYLKSTRAVAKDFDVEVNLGGTEFGARLAYRF